MGCEMRVSWIAGGGGSGGVVRGRTTYPMTSGTPESLSQLDRRDAKRLTEGRGPPLEAGKGEGVDSPLKPAEGPALLDS